MMSYASAHLAETPAGQPARAVRHTEDSAVSHGGRHDA
jgi:hypothetical protein